MVVRRICVRIQDGVCDAVVLCAVDVRREAERGCGDVKKRCGAVAPQELPLIVGGQNASQSARVQRKRRDVSCLTKVLGSGCPS